ncbi:DUF3224 domain-containing protein [Alteromonas pelagimontana]|uniref:DUF3224 domain-containing protein n=1 Tax=Alteromonas pelagimontana TaxID=1858656 RepID=A0A6M4M9F3_9ALTE|nr:DUF3224 domain-containing protein [Alteromonas pelagimontana]QJR79791.1 DUF3224 domain-containing protein [Alteromonas pelagimontana]
MKITGIFNVTMSPLQAYAEGKDEISLGRMGLDKIYQGELDAVGQGEMLSAMTAVKGSAGYVAIEQITGVLCGKKGAFVVQHYGQMHQGDQSLVIDIVPDSGSGELTGIAGTMSITVNEGQHIYELEFSFPQATSGSC